MTMTADWTTISPQNVTGAGVGNLGAAPPLATAAPTPAKVNPPPWSPDSALFWFALVLAGTVGLYVASVTVKTGPAKASVTI